jgi:hypothetical protein
MRNFSKSKLLALRQCPKRLWLEIHRPALRQDSAATQASFQVGHQVGDIAHRIYDPQGLGSLIDVQREGFNAAFARSKALLQTHQPIFEAGFCAAGALAFADVMLPVPEPEQGQAGGHNAWRMVEVKSTTSVKGYHRDDAAIQAFIARAAGVRLQGISLAHIDNTWVYPGGEDYRGLLVEADLTDEAFARTEEVVSWIAQAQQTAASAAEPDIQTGAQCSEPYACGFADYCNRNAPKTEFPVQWLPRIGKRAATLAEEGVIDLRNVPDDRLNDKQRRVKAHTLANTTYFDAEGAAAVLADYGQLACFLDFESIQFAVPIWKGTRPYQQNVFQFSLHTLTASGELAHCEFLDLSGNDPAEPLAQALIQACGASGPIYVYSAFESTRIRELAERFAHLSAALRAIRARIVDSLPVATEHYYHPSQQGSWSLKVVLPAVVPELRYDTLDGVKDGGMAMDAYMEAMHPDTAAERKKQIELQLLAYCKLDTYATVRLWQVFAGRTDWLL